MLFAFFKRHAMAFKAVGIFGITGTVYYQAMQHSKPEPAKVIKDQEASPKVTPGAVVVPKGMQRHEAFAALFNRAQPVGYGVLAANVADRLDSPLNAKQVYDTYCGSYHYCDYVRGRRMKTSFADFPKMENDRYDRQYGEGAMQKVLNDAAQNKRTLYASSVLPTELLAPDDKRSEDDRCKYFTAAYKAHTRPGQEDLEERFADCDDSWILGDRAKLQFKSG